MNSVCRLFDILQVRFSVGIHGGGDADDDAVCGSKPPKICTRFELRIFSETGDPGSFNVPDVGSACVELLYFVWIDIESDHPETDLCKAENQGQAYVTETDDADDSIV